MTTRSDRDKTAHDLAREAYERGDEFRHCYFLAIADRGVEIPCSRCSGLGVRSYPCTSTWRGGIGGQMITKDVCDLCWGSGDKNRTGVNLRELPKFSRIARRLSEIATSHDKIKSDDLTKTLLGLARELDSRYGNKRTQ